MAKLTMKQGRRIYGFIRRNAKDSEAMIEKYVELEERQAISKEAAIVIIGKMHKYEKGALSKVEMEKTLIDMGLPEPFALKDEAKSEPEAKPHSAFADYAQDTEEKTEPKETDLEKMLETLSHILNSDTINELRHLIESDRGKAREEINQLMLDHSEEIDRWSDRVAELEKELEEEKAKPARLPELQPLEGDYIKHEMFDKVAAYVKKGVNVLLTGPAGTGKSMMGREIAKALGMSYFEQSLGGGMRYAQIIGSPEVKDGNSYFKLSEMVEAMQDENTVVILNEIFGLESEVLLAFNDAFEKNTRHIRTKAGRVEIKAKIIATANTTGRSVSRQYTGAQRADDSLLSRFAAKVHIEIDPMVEEKILNQIENETHRADIRTRVRDLRKSINEANIPFDAGTRELVNCIDLYSAIGDVETAFADSFLGGLSKAEKRKLNL